MIETIGNLSLSLAVVAAAAAMLMAIAAFRLPNTVCWRATRWLIVIVAALLTTASAAHMTALLASDFRFSYVASYTERALPYGYKAAAFWAGQEGSLLLWGWLLSILCVVAVIGWRKQNSREFAIAHAVIAIVVGFFAILLLFTANPFELVNGDTPADGRGLNPQLQDIGMIIHPPLLFIGYAGYTMPFALMIGTLIAGPKDNRWLAPIRKWLLLSWMFLGAGIILGAWWAYVELGWGGYWAWDPVENASLLPWLTGTALLHSIIVQQHRGMFKIWNVSLIAGTFLLCIFGTYLTRSGVIESVHAFASSWLGTFFLVFLSIATATSVGLIIWRARSLKTERQMEGLISREGAFLAGNVLLVIMMLTTMIGTIFPLISGVFVDEPVTVKPDFYNKVVAPMALLLVALMAMGPVLAFGTQAAKKIASSMLIPSIAAGIALLLTIGLITQNIWALVCIVIVTVGTFTVIVDFVRSVSARRRSTGETLIACMLQLIDKDHRRYGGQLAHLGVMLIVIGVAASSLFSIEQTHRLAPGEAVALDRYTMKFIALEEGRPEGANYNAVGAVLELTDASGATRRITPQIRFYNGWMEQPNSEVSVESSWREDMYVSLAGWESGGKIVALQVKINPLVLWIWVGGIVMIGGCLFCMMPRLLPRVQFGTRSAPGPETQIDDELHLASAQLATAARELEIAT